MRRLAGALLLSVATSFLVAQVDAQPGGGNDAGIDAIRKRLAAAENASEPDAALRAQIVGHYRSALEEAQAAAAARSEALQLKKKLPEAPAEVQRLERQLREIQTQSSKPLPPFDPALSTSALEKIEAEARAEVESARLQLVELDRAFNDAAVRPLEVRKQQAVLRRELAELESRLDALDRDSSAPHTLVESERVLLDARIDARQARLERLEQELVYQPSQLRMLQLRRDLAQHSLDAHEAELKAAGSALEQRQSADVAKAREEAERAKANSATGSDPIAAIAAVTSERNAQAAETGLALNRSLLELSQRRQEIAAIEQRLRDARRRGSTGVSNADFANDLIREVRALPAKAEQFAQHSAQRSATLAGVHEQQADVARARQALVDLEDATQQSLASVDPRLPPEQRAALTRDARRELAGQRAALDRLDAQLATYAQTLRDTEEIEAELVARAREVRDELIRLLYWVPLAPLSIKTFADVPDSLEWLVDPGHWRSAWKALMQGAGRNPLGLLAAVLALAAVIVTRGRLKAKLAALTPRRIGYYGYGIRHTLGALGIGLVLALPVPLAMWIVGQMIASSAAPTAFTEALGLALRSTAPAILVASAFAWLLHEQGVGINHFGWRAGEAATTRRGVRQLVLSFIPLAFLAMLASATAPESVRQSVGRLAFIALMLVIAWYWARVMVPALSLTRLAGNPNAGLGMRFARIALSRGMVVVPIVLAVVAAFGFFFVAWRLWLLIELTLLVVFLGAILYELLSLFMALQQRKLAAIEAQTAEATPAAACPEGAVTPHEPAIDVDAISTQSRQLLNMLITVALIAGLWAIWGGSLPFLDVIANKSLWSYNTTVDGKAVTNAVTLGGLVLAALVLVVTTVATKNIGGMLDIILLRRLQLQADANYAIKTVARYVIVGIGAVIASNLVGIEWSKAQWLVAALGVGLGFGLQEIVANFVSGLIVLGERPIRIGDVVTVGTVSGTVSRIRARATMVTDFENKEVLIPNKAFITERVVNWTLSSGVTRILITVGVAYGTDPESVQKLLTEVVRTHPDVLADPPPSVFFTAFGQSSLDFEIRVFVDGIAKRLPTQHDLNVAIARTFAENGIEIPFPQQDVHVRSVEGPRGALAAAREVRVRPTA
jgi:potassium efflux system protein